MEQTVVVVTSEREREREKIIVEGEERESEINFKGRYENGKANVDKRRRKLLLPPSSSLTLLQFAEAAAVVAAASATFSLHINYIHFYFLHYYISIILPYKRKSIINYTNFDITELFIFLISNNLKLL